MKIWILISHRILLYERTEYSGRINPTQTERRLKFQSRSQNQPAQRYSNLGTSINTILGCHQDIQHWFNQTAKEQVSKTAMSSYSVVEAPSRTRNHEWKLWSEGKRIRIVTPQNRRKTNGKESKDQGKITHWKTKFHPFLAPKSDLKGARRKTKNIYWKSNKTPSIDGRNPTKTRKNNCNPPKKEINRNRRRFSSDLFPQKATLSKTTIVLIIRILATELPRWH